MRLRGCCDSRSDVFQERNDAPCREIDVQVHYLLCSGPRRRLAVIDFVRKVQSLAVDPDDLGSDAQQIAKVQFSKIERVGFSGKNAMRAAIDIIRSKPKGVAGGVVSPVEHDTVVGHIHVAVEVDPFRQDAGGVFLERTRKLVHWTDHIASSQGCRLHDARQFPE